MIDVLQLLKLEVMSPAWLDIVRGRNPYIFMTEWELTPLLFFAVAAVFFAVFVRERTPHWGAKRTREIYLLLAAPLILSVISFITVDVLALSSFIQLQLYRSLVVWKVILTITFAYYAFTYAKQKSVDHLYSFFLFGIVAATLVEELLVLVWLPFFALLWLERLIGRQANSRRKAWDVPRWLQAVLFLGTFLAAGGAAVTTRPFLIVPFITTIFITVVAVIYTAKPARSMRYAVNSGLLVLLLYASNPPASPLALYPTTWQNANFVEACDWIRQHTAVTAMFAAEPFAPVGEEVKFFCERNLYYSGKDGAQVLFSEAYAREWYRRRQLFDNILPDTTVVQNALRENVDYIISQRSLDDIKDREVWHNATYHIYQIN